ncbi:hypothetical protein GQ457_17G000630 [Hibiscus cannabinus]
MTEDEFNYDDRTGKGPSSWGTLKPEWRTCGVGQRQSPINIRTVQVSSQLRDLQKNYKFAKADLLNTTVNVEVNFIGDAGSITINGTVYRVQNIHWHSPSEHTFGGVRYIQSIYDLFSDNYDILLIIIKEKSTRNPITEKSYIYLRSVHTLIFRPRFIRIAVVSMLYRIGQPDPFLTRIFPILSVLRQTERPLGVVNPEEVGIQGSSFYRYNGSLTVPPCTEDVTWMVYLMVLYSSTIPNIIKLTYTYKLSSSNPSQT